MFQADPAHAVGDRVEEIIMVEMTGAEQLDGRPENITFSMPKELRVRSLI
jgi:4-hydroxy-3-methylbut-2-enyl diphosphate reductase